MKIDLRQVTRLRDHPVGAWSFAVAALLGSLALRFALSDRVPYGVPYLTFFPAVILTAFFAGLWPSIVVAATAGLCAWFFFIPPFWSFEFYPTVGITLLIFLTIAAVDIAIIHFMFATLDRLREEKAKSSALAEQRTLLFNELQHRISNNLGIVSALLNLQRSEVEDETARQALTEASTRLALISKIHRKLHSPTAAQLRFGPFAEDLCRDVLEASGVGNIVCLVSAADAVIPSEQIIPVALIMTELVSNALEHGFPDADSGTIRIDLSSQGTAHVLTVEDNGRGLPDGFSLTEAKSLGLRIVQSLSRQINGEFAMEKSDGTICRLVFPAAEVVRPDA